MSIQRVRLGNLSHLGGCVRTSSAGVPAHTAVRVRLSRPETQHCAAGDGQQQIPFCTTDRDRPTDICGRHFVLKTPFRTASAANHPAAAKAGRTVHRQNLPVNKIRHFVPNTL
ncbi:MAG TPA: hypothetical protein DC058_22545 [Planctomycetaceae bacterium]|nr:hypothetical protein [Planctomycetaceae bacterium]HBC63980.1 hypothetical protein [Planctomycetaceae bacterium]